MNTQNNPQNLSGIRIPRPLRLIAGLSGRERTLLAKVWSAGAVRGCRAPTRELTRLLEAGERQVRSTIASLREKKLVTVRIESGNERTIRPTSKLARLLRRPATKSL